MTRRCLAVHPGALGDVLLGGPALAHLRLLGFRTTLAVASRLAALLRGSGVVDDARDLESLGLHRLFVEGVEPGALASLASFDAVVCWLGAGDPVFRANLARLGRPAVIARAAPAPDAGRHASRHLVETLAPLGPVPSGLPPMCLGVTTAGRAMAGAWLAARGIGLAEAVVLQPGAGSVVKAWPGFPSLTRRLHAAGLPVVVLAGPADGAAVEALLRTGAVAEKSLARDWPLQEVAALLSLARAAVGNDSGPTHLAAAVGCPTVAVFGPTDPAVWAPLGPRVRVVTGQQGAAWADVDRVDAALRALLETPGAGAATEAARAGSGQAWP